jgi:hypothetical protein
MANFVCAECAALFWTFLFVCCSVLRTQTVDKPISAGATPSKQSVVSIWAGTKLGPDQICQVTCMFLQQQSPQLFGGLVAILHHRPANPANTRVCYKREQAFAQRAEYPQHTPCHLKAMNQTHIPCHTDHRYTRTSTPRVLIQMSQNPARCESISLWHL